MRFPYGIQHYKVMTLFTEKLQEFTLEKMYKITLLMNLLGGKVNLNSYNEILDWLEEYFIIRVKDERYLQKMKELIAGSRRQKTVTIRPMQILFLEYVKNIMTMMLQILKKKEKCGRIFCLSGNELR